MHFINAEYVCFACLLVVVVFIFTRTAYLFRAVYFIICCIL